MSFELLNNQDKSILHRDPLGADDFNVDELKEDTVNLSYPFGDIKTIMWTFNGIRITYSNLAFKEHITLEWSGNRRMITMFFSLKGKLLMIGKGLDNRFEIGANQHNMFYGTEASGKMQVENLYMRSFMIQFTEDAFLRIAQDGNDTLKRFADAILQGTPAALSYQNLSIDINIQNCINAIINCGFAGRLKQMFLLSKTIELLVLQAESYDKLLVNKPAYAKTDYDKERLLFARDYMLQHIEFPPALPQLARAVGINEYKLKRGFKEMFGTTVFGYLSEARLELARTNLAENQKSVTEIAFDLGYSSVQHFSNAFKKKFGVSPTGLNR